MATVTITGNTIRGATASKDNRTWQIRAVAYQYGGTGGGVITPGADWETLYPVSGVLTFTAESDAVVDIKTPEAVPYRVRIPTSDAGLWAVIEAGVAYQPDVAQDNLNLAVANAAPGFIAAELGLQTADAIDADLTAREITFTDAGDGEGHFSVGDVAISGTLVPPAATWSGVAGKPVPFAVGYGITLTSGLTDTTVPASRELVVLNNGTGEGSSLSEILVGDGSTQIKNLVLPAKRARRRRQRDIERANGGGRSQFALPAGFTGWTDPGMVFLTDGVKYSTTYDASVRQNTGGTTWFWNTSTGNDTTGDGTSGTPYRTFGKCHTVASDGDEIYLQNSGVVWRDFGPGTVNITKSVNITVSDAANTLFTSADPLSWGATASRTGVYEASRTNVRKVVDTAYDADGLIYTRAASLDACESTPLSWYQATNGTGLVYVHNLDGTSPDAQSVLALLAVKIFQIDTDGRGSDQNLYMEGIRVLGSNFGVKVNSANAYTLTFTAKGCEFLHGGDGGAGAESGGTRYNGFSVTGNVDSVCQDTRVAYSALDGFNYHDAGAYVPNFLEIDCVAHDCGNQVNSAGVNASQNGSTAHDGIKGVRLGGTYHRTFGGVVTDVNDDTQTVNLSCDAYNSTATTSQKQGFSAQQSGAEMWLYGCRSWGCTSDIYCVADATMHVDSSEYETKTGDGTFDITAAL